MGLSGLGPEVTKLVGLAQSLLSFGRLSNSWGERKGRSCLERESKKWREKMMTETKNKKKKKKKGLRKDFS